PDYNPGGKYELLDNQGDFHLDNFINWTRIKTSYASELSPNSELAVLGGERQITFRTASWSPVSLFDALFNEGGNMQHSEFVMSGELGNITAAWSDLKEHPGMPRKIKDEIMIELWKASIVQTSW